MNDRPRQITNEEWIYLAAFSLALLLRLLNLGRTPLTDTEAGWALNALRLFHPSVDGGAGFAANPAYIFLTGVSFLLLGATDFLARFWPALAGALLIWAPFLFRRDIGRTAAWVMALGLAVDPGLVVISRQAGGPMLAITFTLLAFGLWRNHFSVPAGILAGLALLSGPALWPGWLALLLAGWLAARILRRVAPPYDDEEPELEAQGERPTEANERNILINLAPRSVPGESNDKLRRTIIAALVTIILAGTTLMLKPELLASFLGSLITYLGGWTTASGTGVVSLLVILLIFLPLALVFALIHILRLLIGWGGLSSTDRALSLFALLWAGLALLLAVIYPSRQNSDLAWALPPLWLLASFEITRHIPVEQPHVMSYLQGALVVFLGAFFWLTLITAEQLVTPSVSWNVVQLIILAGILVLGLLTTSLVALGWSWNISRAGLAWGGLVLLLVYSTSVLSGATQLRPNQPAEIWSSAPGPGQVSLLMSTIRDFSRWSTGMANTVDIVSVVDAPSLRWELRDFSKARFVNTMPTDQTPSLIITKVETGSPTLTVNYRGQDFVWWVHPGWSGALPQNLKDWFTFRRAPVVNESIILWVRSDIFPGAAQTNRTP